MLSLPVVAFGECMSILKSIKQPKTIPEYQQLVRELVVKRGFDKETVAEVFMMFLEEAGEFAKATRKATGIKVDNRSKIHNLEEEAADVFWLLLDLCNRLDIDLEKAFLDKERHNQARTWA